MKLRSKYYNLFPLVTAYLITTTLTVIPVFMWAQTDILVPKVKQMVVQDYVTETSDA